MAWHPSVGGRSGDYKARQHSARGPDDAVARFWARYLALLQARGVKAKVQRWYVAHAEKYIQRSKGLRLREQGPGDVRRYLEGLGRNPHIEPWHLGQVAHALELLFCGLLAVPWCKEVDWKLWKDGAAPLPPDHPTIARACTDGPGILSVDTGSPGGLNKDKTEDAEGGDAVADLVHAIRVRQYSIRTEQAYVGWVRRFLSFHSDRRLDEMGGAEVKAFLEDLVVRGNVAASTQNQALNALVFLFDKVLERPVGELGVFARSKRPRRLPVVLSHAEVGRLLDGLTGVYQLMAGLLYGSGLRMMECVRLRVTDVDFDYHQLVVRDGKGKKDRGVPLPVRFTEPMREHLVEVKRLHDDDLAQGLGEVYLPYALARKYPHGPREWGWQFVFPSGRLSVDPRSGVRRRHHIHQNGLQKTLKRTGTAVGITKRVGCHCLRHSFATHLLEAGYDIRTVQEFFVGRVSAE